MKKLAWALVWPLLLRQYVSRASSSCSSFSGAPWACTHCAHRDTGSRLGSRAAECRTSSLAPVARGGTRVARVWHTVTGYRRLQRDRWELQLRNMAKQSAKHVGKIEKIEKIWQKMAKMASEAETKILHEIGDSSAKILAKAKAIPNSCSLMLVL